MVRLNSNLVLVSQHGTASAAVARRFQDSGRHNSHDERSLSDESKEKIQLLAILSHSLRAKRKGNVKGNELNGNSMNALNANVRAETSLAMRERSGDPARCKDRNVSASSVCFNLCTYYRSTYHMWSTII
jgi:hypothetical protein